MSSYRTFVIQTHKRVGGGSSKSVRANPIEGQGLDTNMMVSCSSSMRKNTPIGSFIKIEAKLTTREDGPQFLYAHPNSPYEVITKEEALTLIKKERI